MAYLQSRTRGRWTWSASTPRSPWSWSRAPPGVKLPGRVTAALAPTDMSAVVPVQYLADMVVLISDAATGKPVLAVVIEPQLRDSETKRYSWPVASPPPAASPGAPRRS
jgi:hypothetical protein